MEQCDRGWIKRINELRTENTKLRSRMQELEIRCGTSDCPQYHEKMEWIEKCQELEEQNKRLMKAIDKFSDK